MSNTQPIEMLKVGNKFIDAHFANHGAWFNTLCIEIHQREESVLKEVLKTYLGREPQTEDFKKCQKVYNLRQQPYPEIYTFCYHYEVLGTVVKEWRGNVYDISFTPVSPVIQKPL